MASYVCMYVCLELEGGKTIIKVDYPCHIGVCLSYGVAMVWVHSKSEILILYVFP